MSPTDELAGELADAGVVPRAPLVLVIVPDGVALAWPGGSRAVAGDPVATVGAVLPLQPRWTWWSARSTATALVRGGVHLRACWDLGAVGRLLHGLRRDDPAAVWAAAHGLPEPAPLRGVHSDLFDLDDAVGPVCADGQLSREWLRGRWFEDLETAAAWAEVALSLQQQQAAALTALAPYDLEYAEQPCATVEELAALRVALARAGVDLLVAADESVRKAEDPLRVALAGAADVVVLKVSPLSGVWRALEVAQACGLPVVVSSALDTSVGISAGLALAAALPDLPYACGLATTSLMASDVADLLTVDGALPVRPVVPDPARLEALAAPADRRAWWLARAQRCAARRCRPARRQVAGPAAAGC